MDDAYLPSPTNCDTCGSPEIALVTHPSGQQSWRCNACNAAVSCHPGTDLPTGYMATRTVRRLRSHAHTHFDELWKSSIFTRAQAYRWLAREFNLPVSRAHISMLTEDQLRQIEIKIGEFLRLNRSSLEDRAERRKARAHKGYARENKSVYLKMQERKRDRYK